MPELEACAEGSPGACSDTLVHIHPAPQHVEIHQHVAWRASEAILAALASGLCTILQVDFGE